MSQYLASAYYYNANFNVNGLRTSALINILNTRTSFGANNTDFAPDPQSGVGKTLWINAQNGQVLSYTEGTSGILVSTVVAFLTANSLTPPNTDPPCFLEGTKILTDQGYQPIETLRKGDLIKTLLHGFLPIEMIGKKEIFHPASQERVKEQLYQCSKAQYPEITEDLVITGCHCILVDEFKDEGQRTKTEKFMEEIYITDDQYRLPACIDDRTTVYEKPGTYTIYHLALENPDYFMNYGIYANGLLVESCSRRYLKELSNMTLLD
jgi:hypothetical protein